MNIANIAQLATLCMNQGFELPRSGCFHASQNVFTLVERKTNIQAIYKDIFGSEPFDDFISKIDESVDEYINFKFNDVQISLESAQRGFRFSNRTKLFLNFVIENETDLYQLVVPLHHENSELYVFGILPLAEPSRFLDWCEFGFISKSKVSTKETRVHLRFSYTYRIKETKDISPQEYFFLARLEDVILQVFSAINHRRLKAVQGNSIQIDLLRNWCKMKVEQYAKNEIDRIKPTHKIELDESWNTFESFSSWAMQNGYEEELLISRNNEDDSFTPETCIWDGDINSLVERYYWHYFDNTYYSKSSLIDMKVTIKGESKTFRSWQDSTGIPSHIFTGRYFSGLREDDLLAPVEKEAIKFLNQEITINGMIRTVKEWAELAGITPATIISRLQYGWRGEDIIVPTRKKI
ncbi:hypothetical protein [Paenibacillus sediminis]|uniref:Uncharacterized protein n=1 Tax=Paenibacillus sediminis TaxID=664909 RepID=A0ABS4H7L2_9BACL|nr:hypothetical protein [Paenibacillus sediminis]MBP1938528.1 hypothetical protein [Paenibacillus sediminis]